VADETEEGLAERLFAEWDGGAGTSKSELERRTWGDGKSHGRRFDRFVREHLGVSTAKPSKQTDRIHDLEQQVRSLGGHPTGADPSPSDVQLQQARSACLSALRVWNDPTAAFRTGTFSLLFVTAWNSVALAVLMRDGAEWRRLDDDGSPALKESAQQSLETIELVQRAFGGDGRRGLRENLQFWVHLRNAVAHRHLPALDLKTIPFAQAGLLNFEGVLVDEFGEVHQLGEQLSIPLQLTGFRNPDVLASRLRALAALPVDVQAVLSRADEADAELLADETFLMRVAFVPVVPSSGRNPDSVAYFVRPGEVPDELDETLQRYVVLPKAGRGPRPNIGAQQVVEEVQRRIPFRFNTNDHAAVARHLGVRPKRGEPDRSLNELFCDYVTAAKIYVYNQQWIDRVVAEVETAEGFGLATGRDPSPK
jgi:hypothetical protein